jgi:hypothetical protein
MTTTAKIAAAGLVAVVAGDLIPHTAGGALIALGLATTGGAGFAALLGIIGWGPR